ncbi:MAG: hypothetical protein IJV69_01470, partial [Kiritimatiellae bacterium]|nr:hypothetical protein [Kiritimatiellia bacterium]
MPKRKEEGLSSYAGRCGRSKQDLPSSLPPLQGLMILLMLGPGVIACYTRFTSGYHLSPLQGE